MLNLLLRNTLEIPAEGIIKGQGLGIGDKINEVKSTCYSNISFVMRGENSKIILKFLQQQLPGTDIENFTLFNKMWSWYDWTSLLLPRYPTLVLRLVKLLECWIFNFLHLYLTFKHPSIHRTIVQTLKFLSSTPTGHMDIRKGLTKILRLSSSCRVKLWVLTEFSMQMEP